MTSAVTCKQIFCPYIVKFWLFHVLVLANNKLDMADTQSNLHGHADWSAIFAVRKQQSAFLHCRPYVLYLFFPCLHANMLETELATRNL